MPVLFGILTLLLLTGPLFWILRPHRSHLYAWLAALPPGLVTVWQLAQLPAISEGHVFYEAFAWAPSLGLEIALTLDGLALFFGLIVTGIGTGIAFYTNYYFEKDARQGYFYLLLFFFMASMLGLVWSDDLLTLFVFWEFTSISSYLLIAFKTGDKKATEGARQALIVTTAGGLAMLAGFILLGQAAGTFRISAILAQPGWPDAPLYPVIIVLIFLGAFTKSAQFPFQFWLPGAMAAPTPASAYLHSATMVKAGIFLLARLHPGFSDSPLWFWTLFLVGGFTMVLGAVSAIRYTDMKALLAYATISQLGLFAMVLGFPGEEAALTVFVAILGHALYKAPLFLSAGIVDHAMGTRDLRYLANLWRTMPAVMLVAVVAGLSMAGIPPTLGFLAKELLLENFYHLFTHAEPVIGAIGYAASMVMGMFMVAAILTLIWEAFFRRRANVEHPAQLHHKPSFWFAMPALVLALLGTLAPLTMESVERLIYPPVATLLTEEVELAFKLWHGWTPVFISSLVAIGIGVILFALRQPIRHGFSLTPLWLSCLRGYDAIIDGTYRVAYRVTVIVQGGPMAPQIAVILLSGVLAIAFALTQANFTQGIVLDSYDLPTVSRDADRCGGDRRCDHDRAGEVTAERDYQSWRCRCGSDALLHLFQRAGPGIDPTAHRGTHGHPVGAGLLPCEARLHPDQIGAAFSLSDFCRDCCGAVWFRHRHGEPPGPSGRKHQPLFLGECPGPRSRRQRGQRHPG